MRNLNFPALIARRVSFDLLSAICDYVRAIVSTVASAAAPWLTADLVVLPEIHGGLVYWVCEIIVGVRKFVVSAEGHTCAESGPVASQQTERRYRGGGSGAPQQVSRRT